MHPEFCKKYAACRAVSVGKQVNRLTPALWVNISQRKHTHKVLVAGLFGIFA